MTARREQSKQEKALRRYFKGRRTSGAVWTIGIAALLFLGGLLAGDDVGSLGILGGLVLGAVGVLWFLGSATTSIPSDKKVDSWLQEGVDRLNKESLGKLDLVEADVMTDPLVITGPILWTTYGIDENDLVWKIGKDGLVRFGVYRVTIIQLTDRHMGIYACDYNFIRDVALNEETDEYHYQDVVTVSTKEAATSYTLPSRKKLTNLQEFRLSVTSGESVSVVVDTAKLSEVTGGEKMPETGAEKAVSAIRAMLREKKP